MTRKKLFAFLIINILIIIFETIGLIITFSEIGLKALQYYTNLSNIFLLDTAIINSIFAIRSILNKKAEIPKLVWSLFYASVSATTLTFLVVVFILSWMYGDLWFVLTKSAMLYTHTICPLLGIICFTIFAPNIFKRKSALYATSLTTLYAIVAMTANIARVWYGPYPFLYVYDQPIWVSITWGIILLTGAYGISRLLIIGKVKKESIKEKNNALADKTRRKKDDLLLLIPVLIIVFLVLPGIIYAIFYMPIDVNKCDSLCHPSKSKTTPKSGRPNPYEVDTCPAVCVVTYTTIWRKITGQDRISHY